MREPDRDKGRIEDMIEASNNVISFVDGLSFNDCSNDKLGSISLTLEWSATLNTSSRH